MSTISATPRSEDVHDVTCCLRAHHLPIYGSTKAYQAIRDARKCNRAPLRVAGFHVPCRGPKDALCYIKALLCIVRPSRASCTQTCFKGCLSPMRPSCQCFCAVLWRCPAGFRCLVRVLSLLSALWTRKVLLESFGASRGAESPAGPIQHGKLQSTAQHALQHTAKHAGTHAAQHTAQQEMKMPKNVSKN